jgi:hypothetical protein
MLKILSSGQYFSTNIFKDLRLVIEWNTGFAKAPTNLASILKPILIYDKIINPKMISEQNTKLKSAKYIFSPIERDVAYIPIVPINSTVNSNFVLKGFEGKTLTKVVIIKDSGQLGSSRLRSGGGAYSERYNFVVNGKQLLPYEGITRPQQKLRMLEESWGNLNSVYSQNNNGATSLTLTFTGGINQQKDYIGCIIQEKIDELQLTYSSTAGAAASVALTLQVYGEVIKAVVVSGDSYNVAYV